MTMTALDSGKIIQASHPTTGRLPSLEDLQLKLTDFILHLIQAFLRTGYYTSEHPESKRAKEGLYQQFQSFFEQEGELTFLLREDQERKDVLLEGLFPEAQRLNRMMAKGMGELYVPRMVKYLERKDLVSLTLKSRMDATEFIHFVDVMSEPSLVDILKEINTSPSSQMDQIETQIYHAFGTLGNIQVAGETPEEILLKVLEKRGIKKWGGLFQKNQLTDSALGAICDALGKMGTQRSVKTLHELKKSLDGPWVQRVGDVIRKIEERAA
jgi:hypothetical protein